MTLEAEPVQIKTKAKNQKSNLQDAKDHLISLYCIPLSKNHLKNFLSSIIYAY
jgi:hypothetical protein